MNANKVTNLTYLNDIAKGNSAFIAEMIAIFMAESPADIARLGQAIAAHNFDGIRAHAHHLKSSVPFVGLDAVIGNELVQIEQLATDKLAIETIQQKFNALQLVFAQAWSELELRT